MNSATLVLSSQAGHKWNYRRLALLIVYSVDSLKAASLCSLTCQEFSENVERGERQRERGAIVSVQMAIMMKRVVVVVSGSGESQRRSAAICQTSFCLGATLGASRYRAGRAHKLKVNKSPIG